MSGLNKKTNKLGSYSWLIATLAILKSMLTRASPFFPFKICSDESLTKAFIIKTLIFIKTNIKLTMLRCLIPIFSTAILSTFL